jgi:hypothetical protein
MITGLPCSNPAGAGNGSISKPYVLIKPMKDYTFRIT